MANMLYKSITPQHDINEPHLEFLSILVAGLLVNFLYTTDTHANNCFVSLSPRRIPGYNFYLDYPLQGTIPEKRTYVEQDERIKCTIQLLMSNNPISSVIVSMLAANAVDRGFDSRVGSKQRL